MPTVVSKLKADSNSPRSTNLISFLVRPQIIALARFHLTPLWTLNKQAPVHGPGLLEASLSPDLSSKHVIRRNVVEKCDLLKLAWKKFWLSILHYENLAGILSFISWIITWLVGRLVYWIYLSQKVGGQWPCDYITWGNKSYIYYLKGYNHRVITRQVFARKVFMGRYELRAHNFLELS